MITLCTQSHVAVRGASLRVTCPTVAAQPPGVNNGRADEGGLRAPLKAAVLVSAVQRHRPDENRRACNQRLHLAAS